MKLIAYDEKKIDQEKLNHYYLPEEQAVYSAFPNDAIKRAENDPELHPVFLTDDEYKELFVFFLLHEKEGVKPYSSNKKSLLLRSFSTNHEHQGNSYATKALLLLDEYVAEHFPETNEMVLGVNSKNESAIHLYKKCGYSNEVKRMKTEYGVLIVLSKEL